MDARPDETYRLVTSPDGEPGITCEVCGMTSYHPGDIEHRYCAACHRFHGEETSWPAHVAYPGPRCPRRCHLCPEPPEHHWMIDFGEMDDHGEVPCPEGFLSCRHCDATRDIPDDDAFQDAFFI